MTLSVTMTFGRDGDDAADKDVWMSIWVDDADAVHQRCPGTGPRGHLAADEHALACRRNAGAEPETSNSRVEDQENT